MADGQRVNHLVYDLRQKKPFAEYFGLKGQIQRAAVSIMSNIAEGFESHTQLPFINYLGRAKGSAGEARSQLYVALDRKYISQEEFNQVFQHLDKSSRQIYRFIKHLESQPNTRRVREGSIVYEIKH